MTHDGNHVTDRIINVLAAGGGAVARLRLWRGWYRELVAGHPDASALPPDDGCTYLGVPIVWTDEEYEIDVEG